MPELPEVETIKNALQKHLPGKQIVRVLIRDARLRSPVNKRKLRQLVVGQRIRKIDRRAKYLLVCLENQSTLVIHLGMSGRLLLLRESLPFEKHDHVIFYFDDQSELRFRDPRRFGLIDVVSEAEFENYPLFAHLGFEPLDSNTRPPALFEYARRLKKPIKNLLMDANFIVGVGNIYANEALFHAGIHPFTPAQQLSLADWQRLHREIRRVLKKALQKGGTTLNDFVNSDGEMGYFQLSLAVYAKEGERCPKCGTKIERVVQVGRSTFFCPRCQREIK
jgi:formamidopyrimidine-DNA glycosylase